MKVRLPLYRTRKLFPFSSLPHQLEIIFPPGAQAIDWKKPLSAQQTITISMDVAKLTATFAAIER
jgi:hypothetical protein